MWQTKYASAVPKNLGFWFDFRLCSEGVHSPCFESLLTSEYGLRNLGDRICGESYSWGQLPIWPQNSWVLLDIKHALHWVSVICASELHISTGLIHIGNVIITNFIQFLILLQCQWQKCENRNVYNLFFFYFDFPWNFDLNARFKISSQNHVFKLILLKIETHYLLVTYFSIIM